MKITLIPSLRFMLQASIGLALCLSFNRNLSAEEAPGKDLFGQNNDAAKPGKDRPERKEERKPDRPSPAMDRPAPSAEDIASLFTKLDVNGDGSLSKDEFAAFPEAQKQIGEEKRAQHEAEMLASFDVNGDGELSPEERKAANQERVAQQIKDKLNHLKQANPEKFAEFDSNSDGTIDDDEVVAAQTHMLAKVNERLKENPELFAKADANGDGTVDQEELQHLQKKRAMENQAGAGHEHGDSGVRKEGRPAENADKPRKQK